MKFIPTTQIPVSVIAKMLCALLLIEFTVAQAPVETPHEIGIAAPFVDTVEKPKSQ